jgi:dephospho-CoA kinase
MLLGICGPSGSHKSSLTRYLKSAYGFKRIHSGKPIKKAARQGFGLPKPLVAGKAKDMPTDRLGGCHSAGLNGGDEFGGRGRGAKGHLGPR